jgi:hypothetical protein
MTCVARMLLTLIAASLFVNVACSAHISAEERKTDRAVLASVVALQCEGEDRGKVLLSSKPTAPDEAQAGHPGGISQDQIADLIGRTQTADLLPRGIECPRVRIVSYARLKAALDRPATHPMTFPVPAGVPIPIAVNTGFKDAFPDVGVLLRLSMPIYTENKDTAIVYFAEDCGGLCAHGEYVVLEHVKGSWQVVRRVQVWAS